MVPRAKIVMGAPRVMVSYAPGMRPNKRKGSKSFLPEGGLFLNFPDNILCVGTGLGGWAEFALTRVAVVNELDG